MAARSCTGQAAGLPGDLDARAGVVEIDDQKARRAHVLCLQDRDAARGPAQPDRAGLAVQFHYAAVGSELWLLSPDQESNAPATRRPNLGWRVSPPPLHTPTPASPQVSARMSPVSTVARTRTSRRIPGARRMSANPGHVSAAHRPAIRGRPAGTIRVVWIPPLGIKTDP